MNLTPEHVHVMLNHIPVVGMPLALLPLVLGVVFNHRLLWATGLIIVVLCAASTGLAVYTGELAYQRFEQGQIEPPLDEPGDAWMHEHEQRAIVTAVATYVVGGLALSLLPLSVFKPTWARWGSGAIAALALVLSLGFAWVALAGGMIRHPEFRDPLAPFPPHLADPPTSQPIDPDAPR